MTTSPPQKAPDSLVTRRMDDIEAKPVSWLWPNRLARGKFSLIAGNPGLGKSQITASIAAVVTSGGRWPVDGGHCAAGDVLILSAEDDPADTIRPRLEAAGAVLSRIEFVDGVAAGYSGSGRQQMRMFSMADIDALGAKLHDRQGAVAALIIDPISAYLGGADSHVNSEVRGLLAPLADLAAAHEVAIIGVSHLTKTTGAQAIMRVSGSLAFVAAARAAYLVAADPDDPTRRFLLTLKNNLGPSVEGLAYRIEGVTIETQSGLVATSRVAWESEAVTITADDVMAQTVSAEDISAIGEAMDFFCEKLDGGPLPATEVQRQARAAGISKATLRRAAVRLGIERAKSGMRGGWTWSLPPKVLNSPEGVQEPVLSTFDTDEHLPAGPKVGIDT